MSIMNRILTLLFTLFAVALLEAQTLEDQQVQFPDDSIAGDSVVIDIHAISSGDIANQGVPSYMQKALFRSWRLAHPLKSTVAKPSTSRLRLPQVDSLLQLVNSLPVDHGDMLYLYDMRLPLINSGSVPADSLQPFWQLSARGEEQQYCLDLPVPHFEDTYLSQQENEMQRHVARFKYAAPDPRRFRYARRNFFVPTADSRTIDTKESVQNVRVVDDIVVDFGNTDIDLWGPGVVLKADKWHWKGDHTLTMQQTALSENWYKGGDNNMSISSEQKFTISRYDEEKKTNFETIIDLKLSGYYTKADTIHRMKVSDNELSLNVKYGYRAWKKWYYSAQLYAKTPVFDYYNHNSNTCVSTLFSPLELNLSLGVDYQYTSPNKRFVYSLLLAPLSYDLKAVSDDRIDVTKYGIEAGNSTLHNFGSTVTSKMEWKMSENASWSSRLYYFTTYNSVKVEFENTLNFRISRFFSTRIYAYPRFDDTRDRKIEIKEMLTVGFSYQW